MNAFLIYVTGATVITEGNDVGTMDVYGEK